MLFAAIWLCSSQDKLDGFLEITHGPSADIGTLLAWESRASSVACTEAAGSAGVSALAGRFRAACGGAERITGSITASDSGAGTSTKQIRHSPFLSLSKKRKANAQFGIAQKGNT
jgi:hypothetical protein